MARSGVEGAQVILIDRQERGEGSWWDIPLVGQDRVVRTRSPSLFTRAPRTMHQEYDTALFALIALRERDDALELAAG